MMGFYSLVLMFLIAIFSPMLETTRQERDILKKALAFFAKDKR